MHAVTFVANIKHTNLEDAVAHFGRERDHLATWGVTRDGDVFRNSVFATWTLFPEDTFKGDERPRGIRSILSPTRVVEHYWETIGTVPLHRWYFRWIDGDSTSYMILSLVRIRNDQLKCWLEEWLENGVTHYAPRAKHWLDLWWDDAIEVPNAGELQVANMNSLSAQPPIPNSGGYEWDDVFDWYYRGGRLRHPNLKALASQIGLSEKTIYNNHSLYKEQYGEQPKPDTSSKYGEVRIRPGRKYLPEDAGSNPLDRSGATP